MLSIYPGGQILPSHRNVSVPWQAKALAFQIFDKAPFGERLYYYFQNKVTKTLPRALSPTSKTGSAQISHAKLLATRQKDLSGLSLLEIGAGWDLYANLIYYCYGIDHQIAVDIRRWARAETVNSVICHLQKDPPPDCIRVPQTLVCDENFEADLNNNYGIDYYAPFDATSTGFATGSIDVIFTTSVLEHVPAEVCAAIFREFRRIISPGGIMRHTIDYSDHYSHADPSITAYNYLRFSEAAWRLLNPSIHYQNRLRTPDFVNICQHAGFKVAACDEWIGLEEDLAKVNVHRSFARYSREELMALGAHFLIMPD